MESAAAAPYEFCMKQLSLLALAVTLVSGAWGETGFWQQLTPEERQAAGIESLTAEQQAALDRAATRFAREGARQAREEAKIEARKEAKSEAKAEVKAEASAGVGFNPRTGDDEVIRTRIAGKFNGWSKGTMFQLQNGQSWMAEAGDPRWFPTKMDPEVELRPAGFGSWKLFLVDGGLWVRVKRVR